MSQCSGSDSGSPPRSQISTQKTRNKESVRTLEDTVLWARNEGLGDHLRLANPQGETQAGKLFCWACAAWIVAKGCNLKDHVLGKNKRKADGTYERQPGGHARKLSSLPKEKEPAKPMSTPEKPTIIVNVDRGALDMCTPACTPPTPAKKQKVSDPLGDMLRKGQADDEFSRDTVRTWTSCNIPLETLGKTPMKTYFGKYMPNRPLRHPNNYRGTWLPKVANTKRERMEAIIRKREHYVCIFADETDDPRPTVDYQLGVGVVLVPKEFSESAGPLAFHLDLCFPEEVNNITVSDSIDEVFRNFHVHPEDVRLFVHDSAGYMGKSAVRLRDQKGYTNLVHLPCWAHLIALVPQAVFDSGHLKDAGEFNRLVQLLFARYI